MTKHEDIPIEAYLEQFENVQEQLAAAMIKIVWTDQAELESPRMCAMYGALECQKLVLEHALATTGIELETLYQLRTEAAKAAIAIITKKDEEIGVDPLTPPKDEPR